MATTKKRMSPTAVNYLVDMTIFLAFLVAMDPRSTGIAIHEWLSMAFGAAIITHLILHWSWLVGITRRLFGRITGEARINYILNWLFFVDMTIIMFTGILISEAVLPTLGLSASHSFAWRRLHDLSANLALPILGLHIALHWRWIVNTTKNFFGRVRVTSSMAPVSEPVVQKGA